MVRVKPRRRGKAEKRAKINGNNHINSSSCTQGNSDMSTPSIAVLTPEQLVRAVVTHLLELTLWCLKNDSLFFIHIFLTPN